jgi:hypothetical protein
LNVYVSPVLIVLVLVKSMHLESRSLIARTATMR